ncbi:MAG: cytochrome oxidase [Proteobacteria bacterium]|nr:cytochrome oxidase [Pseudomonadota bacterium]
MTPQDRIWLITLLGIALVALVFIYVIARSGGVPAAAGEVQTRAYAIRRWWFIALLVLGVGVTWATLRPFPVADQRQLLPGAQIVDVVAHQWFWELSRTQVNAGQPVEFRVTSADVNHGFAIYGPDDRIVVQTQAMPAFTNRLVHTFRRPGFYRVLCLEYCGLAHHGMANQFEVVATTGAKP